MNKYNRTDAANRLNFVVYARQLVALTVASLWLGACSKGAPELPMPTTKPVPEATAPTTAGASDPSVPAAASVVFPGRAAPRDPAAGRTNATLSKAQESSAMPMPGQNNDHSAPVTPTKGASAP